jgi:integral membrane protein
MCGCADVPMCRCSPSYQLRKPKRECLISAMNSNGISSLQRFRFIALVEGVSLLVLLFIAMPLKYFADEPAMVKYVGWAHGILFLLYLIFLLDVWIKLRWNFGKVLVAFMASLIPFGTFLFEGRLKKESRTSATSGFYK